jgi:hypothetical protein
LQQHKIRSVPPPLLHGCLSIAFQRLKRGPQINYSL